MPGFADGVVGAVLLIGGLCAGQMRAARVGGLMAIAGGVWLLGTLLPAALLWHRGPLTHLDLSFPTGRLRRRLAVVTVTVGYGTAIVPLLARNDWVTLVVAALVAVTAVVEFRRTSGPDRRAGRVGLLVSLAFAAALGFGAVTRIADWDADLAVLLAYDAVVVASAIGMLLDLRFGRWVDATAADLVIGLGDESASLQARLRRAMGDPSVVVGFWLPDAGRYVDEDGVAVSTELAGRVVTPVDDRGGPLAVVVHDAAVVRDQELLAAVTAAARLVATNVRLRAGIRDRAEQLTESRRRIVEAADRQRRDLEAELAAGTAQRLDLVDEMLVGLPTAEELRTELAGARAELADFAHGVRPAALTTGGLTAALPLLAGRSPVPVRLIVRAGRLPAAVEACVYFVCAESLANVAKHADAACVTIDVRAGRDNVTARIDDDGAGGADPSTGTGLRGLTDRVEALGGTITVRSEPGDGTTVVATLPG